MPDSFAASIKHLMEPTPTNETAADREFDRNFKPRGAITFFILLVILGLIIWYGIYFLMLQRA